MSKRVFALALACLILMMTGCQSNDGTTNGGQNGGSENGGTDNNAGGEVYEERNEDGDVIFRGEVKEAYNKRYISVYIENAVTKELYHVLIGDVTILTDENGNTITEDQIKVGDKVEIGFSGQVMMSYPPQIAARSIKIIK